MTRWNYHQKNKTNSTKIKMMQRNVINNDRVTHNKPWHDNDTRATHYTAWRSTHTPKDGQERIHDVVHVSTYEWHNDRHIARETHTRDVQNPCRTPREEEREWIIYLLRSGMINTSWCKTEGRNSFWLNGRVSGKDVEKDWILKKWWKSEWVNEWVSDLCECVCAEPHMKSNMGCVWGGGCCCRNEWVRDRWMDADDYDIKVGVRCWCEWGVVGRIWTSYPTQKNQPSC